MLIKYEYELLSYIANKGIKKVNNDLAVSIKRISDELEEDIQIYLESLQLKGFITIEKDTVTIKSVYWIKFFIQKLNDEFNINNFKISCDFNNEKFNIEFEVNGTIQNFNIILNTNNISDKNNEEKSIFMCKPNCYEDKIFWLDLLNDINLLMMFSSYLTSEISNMNKTIYRKIDTFDGINEAYISEIFNNSIKNYFQNKQKNIMEFDKEYIYIIKKIIRDENVSYYGVEFDNKEVLLIVKKNKEILFFTVKDKDLIYSNEINNEINELNKKIFNKVSEYRKLIMFKENNIIDNSLKLISNLAVFFVPLAVIINILGFFNLNISSIQNYKWLLIIIIIVLAFIQSVIVYFIYIPAIKMSKFKWKL